MKNRELAKLYVSKVDGEDFYIDYTLVDDTREVLKNTLINMSNRTFPPMMWEILIERRLGDEGLKTGIFQEGFLAFGKNYCKGDTLEDFLTNMGEYTIFEQEIDFIRQSFQLAQAILNGIDVIKIATDDEYFEIMLEMADTEDERKIWERLLKDPNVFLVFYKKEDKARFIIPFAIERVNGEPTLFAKLGENSLLEKVAQNSIPYLKEILELGAENQKQVCSRCLTQEITRNMEYMAFSDSFLCPDCLVDIAEGDAAVHFSIMFNDQSIETLNSGLIGDNFYKTVKAVQSAHEKLEWGDGVIFQADAIDLNSETAARNWNVPLKLQNEGCTLTEQNFYFGDVIPSVIDDILHDIYRLPTSSFHVIVSGSLDEDNYEYVMRKLFDLQFSQSLKGRIDSLSIHSQCLEVRGLKNEY